MLSSAKRKVEKSSNEGGSSDAAKLVSPQASPVKSRAHLKEEERKEEEEASNRVSPLPVTWRCKIRPATKGR